MNVTHPTGAEKINRHDTGVVILAAGLSERMQSPKALLPFNPQSTFIEKIIELYSGWGCGEIVAVVNKVTFNMMNKRSPLPAPVTIVINNHPEYERFYSVKSGLGALKRSVYCFVHNVDNPFIKADILDVLYRNRSSEAFVSPVFQRKGGHPVLLNRKTMEFIRNYQENAANLKDVLNRMECIKVEMQDARVLININSPEDYERQFNLR